MRIVIIGAGAVGFHLARRLTDEGHDVVIIDTNPDKVRRAGDSLDVIAIEGNGASIPVLEEAGIAKADILVAVAHGDEVNLMACLIASRRGVPIKVARVSHPEYHAADSILSREELGVDLMIGPEQECAWEAFQLLNAEAATDFARFAEGKVHLVGMRVREGAPVAGKTLIELDREMRGRPYVAAAIVRNGVTEIPTGASRIEAGDKIFVLAPAGEASLLPPLAGYDRFRLRRVMIAGGSDEAVYLAQHLAEHKVSCTILERDRDRCRELARILPHALILQGDATDLELLEMEGVEGIDGFVALTDRDEVNMLSALLAKTSGAHRVIPLIHRVEYMKLVEKVGLDAAVSPRISAVNAILQHVRRGPVTSVATMKDTRAEAIELMVAAGSRLAGRKVRDIEFPSGAVLGAIVRRDKVIMPRGRHAIEAGDHVVFFVLPHAIEKVERLAS
jgi:trk system potassium uptake protein